MPGDFQYLYQDLFVISTLFVTVSMTDSMDKLSIEMPSDSLFGFQCVFSVLS